jgi:tetratricopeptide (TPR) repeat protein
VVVACWWRVPPAGLLKESERLTQIIMMKYIVLGLAVVSMTAFAGCGGLQNKTSRNKEPEQRLALIDQKIQEMQQSLSQLSLTDQNIERRVDELSQKTHGLDENYLHLKATTDSLNSKLETKDNSARNSVVDVQRNIDDLEKKLSRIEEIEKVKTDLQNQIIVLLSQRQRLARYKLDQQGKGVKEAPVEEGSQGTEGTKEPVVETHEEKKSETLTTEQQNARLQFLLDDALAVYRTGDYEKAIRKWEEALKIDPENLEAKFNIDIAKERLKSNPEK